MKEDTEITLISTIDLLGYLGWVVVLLWYLGDNDINAGITPKVILIHVSPIIFPVIVLAYFISGHWNKTYYVLLKILFAYSSIGLIWAIIILINLFI